MCRTDWRRAAEISTVFSALSFAVKDQNPSCISYGTNLLKQLHLPSSLHTISQVKYVQDIQKVNLNIITSRAY